MLALMATIVLAIFVVGTAALAGHPLYFIAAGFLIAATILLLARRNGGRVPVRRHR